MASSSTHVIGIDVGTGGAKVIIIDAAGNVAANVTIPYPLSTPKPLWSEQSPDDWWNATCEGIKRAVLEAHLAPEQIAAVGLTGQMHGLVMLDSAGDVLRPAILWNDQRTGAQCDAIHERVGLERMIEITGKPALTGFTAPKILWVRDHEPDVYAHTRTMLLPKDFVRSRLTGGCFSDVADASGTSLFDVRNRDWSQEILAALDVPRDVLPDVTESPVASATISDAGAAATGLLEGTPVVAGAGDQAAEAIGCGLVEGGAVSVAVGTSGVVFAVTDSMRTDPAGRLHAYCHAMPGMWHVMGVMLSAGGSLRWFHDAVWRAGDRDEYDALVAAAASVEPGCEGLTFLPYLTGERTPHADPYARGAFVGLTLRHDRAHMARAVIEGVTFGLMDSVLLAREMGVEIPRVRVSGGGARSAMWRQIMADVFNAEIATINVSEGAAFGAAILALVGGGLAGDVPSACGSVVRETAATQPAEPGRYEDAYEHYRTLYPALKPHFRSLHKA